MNTFASNLITFETHLDELNLILAKDNANKRIKTYLNQIANWAIMDAHQKGILKDYFAIKETRDVVLYNSLYLSATASFESYLVGTLYATIFNINSTVKKFDDLKPELINKHMNYTGRILTHLYTPPDHIKIDFFKLCKQIGTCYPGSTEYQLNPEISSFVTKILELDNFFDFLKSCDVNLSYDEIAKSTALKAQFKITGNRELANAIQEYITSLVRFRNRLAHTGQSVSDITLDTLQTLITTLQLIAKRINEIMEAKFK